MMSIKNTLVAKVIFVLWSIVANSANASEPSATKTSQPTKQPVAGAPTDFQKSEEAAEVTYFDQDPKSWARVRRMVSPTYPEVDLKSGVGGVIDIDVLIDVFDAVKEVHSIQSNPVNAEFEEAGRRVLKYWQFSSPSIARCVPYETDGSVRLTFEVVDGMPKIMLSHRQLPPALSALRIAPTMLNRAAMATQTVELYPRTARREGAQATVY